MLAFAMGREKICMFLFTSNANFNAKYYVFYRTFHSSLAGCTLPYKQDLSFSKTPNK
jgi:hypothetical protein